MVSPECVSASSAINSAATYNDDAPPPSGRRRTVKVARPSVQFPEYKRARRRVVNDLLALKMRCEGMGRGWPAFAASVLSALAFVLSGWGTRIASRGMLFGEVFVRHVHEDVAPDLELPALTEGEKRAADAKADARTTTSVTATDLVNLREYAREIRKAIDGMWIATDDVSAHVVNSSTYRGDPGSADVERAIEAQGLVNERMLYAVKALRSFESRIDVLDRVFEQNRSAVREYERTLAQRAKRDAQTGLLPDLLSVADAADAIDEVSA